MTNDLALQDRLKNLMKEHGMNAPKVARKAGIHVSSVKNILQGVSKNPSSKTLQALTRAFNCSVSDFIIEHPPANDHLPDLQTSRAEIDLFKKTLSVIDSIAKEKQLVLDNNNGLRGKLANEIYRHAVERQKTSGGKEHTIDMDFARWLVGEAGQVKG